MPLNSSDIFLFVIFIALIAIYDLFNRGILNMEILHTITTGNAIIYIFLVVAFIYLRKNIMTPQISSDPSIKKLENAILVLNNEMNRMRTETEWRSEIRSQGNNIVILDKVRALCINVF